MADGQGAPLAATATAASVNEVAQVLVALAGMPAVGGRPGPKRGKPERLQGGRGHDSGAVGRPLRWPGIAPVPARRNTRHVSGAGVSRWFAERTTSWPHAFGRLRRRRDRRTEVQQAFLRPAGALICLRSFAS